MQLFRKSGMRAFVLVLLTVVLVACGTAQHSIRIADKQAFRSDTTISVGQIFNKTGESFDVDIETMLRDAMVDALEKEKLLGNKGDPGVVSMDVNIVEYRKGDAFKRWLWPGYGSTVLVVEATLLDGEGSVDATAQANRTVDAGGGYTVGAWKRVFDDVAADLVSDLKTNIAGAQAY